MRPHLLLVRAPGADRTDDDGEVVSSGHPATPASWSVVQWYAGTVGVYEVRPGPRVTLHVIRQNARPDDSEALYAVFGDKSYLDSLRDHMSDSVQAATMRDVWSAAMAGNDTVRMALRAWRDWRITGQVRVSDEAGAPVTVDVTDHPWRLNHGADGNIIPDPSTTALPWLLGRDGSIVASQSDAWARVTALHRPALLHSVAGWHDPASFDAEAV